MLHPDRVGVQMRNLDVIDLDVNRQVAMRAGVLDGDPRVFVVVAVDQQQEVNRSPYVEGPFPFDPHRMEIVAERPTPRLVLVSQ